MRASTSPLFQYGVVLPGSGLKSWSPLQANLMVAFCLGFGAVLKVPTSLRLPPLPAKRNQYFVFACSRFTCFCTVLSWPFLAVTDCDVFPLNLPFRATSSEYLPLLVGLAPQNGAARGDLTRRNSELEPLGGQRWRREQQDGDECEQEERGRSSWIAILFAGRLQLANGDLPGHA